MKQMSVQQALILIKRLKEDLSVQSSLKLSQKLGHKGRTPFSASVRVTSGNKDEVTSLLGAELDRRMSMLEALQTLKRAVTKSNAVTTIKIADREMTVAEAIGLKESLDYYVEFHKEMGIAANEIAIEKEKHRTSLDNTVASRIGTINAVDESQKTVDMIAIQKGIRELVEQEFATIWPAEKDVKAIEEKYGSFITAMQNDFDIAIVTSNISTMIEVNI